MVEFSINDFKVGQRVELHPACDLWARGARYGDVMAIGRIRVYVKLDRVRKMIPVEPRNIGAIIE